MLLSHQACIQAATVCLSQDRAVQADELLQVPELILMLARASGSPVLEARHPGCPTSIILRHQLLHPLVLHDWLLLQLAFRCSDCFLEQGFLQDLNPAVGRICDLLVVTMGSLERDVARTLEFPIVVDRPSLVFVVRAADDHR